MTHLTISAQQLAERFSLLEEDLTLIRKLGEKLSPRIEGLIEKFYEWLPILPEYQQFFPVGTSTERVKMLQVRYWQEFFLGKLDDAYVLKRQEVGGVHATIGLSLHGYLAAANQMFLLVCEEASTLLSERTAETLRAVAKLVHVDTAIIVDAFTTLSNERLTAQSEAIVAMSTPVAEIAKGILMLPLVGIIDSARAHDTMSAMLNQIRQAEARVFILDISGVAVVDTAVANHLIKMTKAAQLMGCDCVVSGLSPAIAETIVTLDIDVSTIDTRATLKDALATALVKTGLRLTTFEAE